MSPKIKYLLCCFFIVLQQTFAQGNNIDSLNEILLKLPSKSVDYKEKKAETAAVVACHSVVFKNED